MAEHAVDDLPELALGLLDGDAQTRALTHVEGCDRCRRELDELVRAVEAVVLAGPTAEPPPGFESAVLARIASPARRRPARLQWLAAAAAAVLAVAGLAGVVLRADGSAPPAAVASVLLSTDAGAPVGWAWLLPGHPAAIAVDMAYASTSSGGSYDVDVLPMTIELVGGDGKVVERVEASAFGGRLNLVARLDGGIDGVRLVRMVGAGGRVLCHGPVAS